ncbi:MAG: winged helix-turn-helix domain-containing protein [Candidatus Bathyarchaeia archaeon]
MKISIDDAEIEVSLPAKIQKNQGVRIKLEEPCHIIVETQGTITITGPSEFTTSEFQTHDKSIILIEPIRMTEKEFKEMFLKSEKKPRGETARKILDALEGDMTVSQLSRKTGLPTSTVFSALRRLLKQKIVVRTSRGTYRKSGTVVSDKANRNLEIPIMEGEQDEASR